MIELVLAIPAAGLAIVLLGFGLLMDNRRLAQILRPEPWTGPSAGKVSVIVPARNEAHNIRRCVESLLAQDYPDWEVLVIDDHSEDGTFSILADLARRDTRLKVLIGEDLPGGWMGKSWAVHQAMSQATGEWLLFTDADTCHHPSSLSTTLRYMIEEEADFVTSFPYQECESFWERVVQPVVPLAAFTAKRLRRMEDRTCEDVIAVGQFLFFRREMYERIGGHAAIRSSVVDDVSLARAVRQQGGKLKFPLVSALVRVRMYTSFHELWQGWSKNLFGGAGGDWRLAVTAALVWTMAAVWPWLLFPWYLGRAALGDHGWDVPWGIGLVGANIVLTLAARNLMLPRLVDHSPAWSLAHPLGFLVYSLLMLNSMRRGLLGLGPQWKGRVYPGMHL